MVTDDDTFRLFAGNLERAIERYGEMPDEDLLAQQCRQFETLVELETQFRATLIRNRYGTQVYRAFVKKICEENGNILTSRPYFRERQDVCIGPIAQALKNRSIETLYQFHFNHNFVAFVMRQRHWPAKGCLAALAKRIESVREEIVQMNMPLAISQARIFWHKAPVRTQDTRFTFMDFVQVACDGLMSAVDKFVLPFARVWRAVAIGRMRGNFIETFNETTIHFYPQDKRKIYRANKHLKDFQGGVDFEKLAGLVNGAVDASHRTSPEELAQLMAASARTASADATDESENPQTLLHRFAAAPEWQPDVRYEDAEALNVLRQSVELLPLMEQKLLRLRGVALDSI